MADGLYDVDVVVWSEQQAGLLRRLAAGERVGEAVDWGNVIEEIETVGWSELHALDGLLREAMIRLLKLHAWPGSRSVRRWQGETIEFLFQAGRYYAPSMRQRIDMEGLYRSALRVFRLSDDEAGMPLAVAEGCPFSLDALLAAEAEPLRLAELARGADGAADAG